MIQIARSLILLPLVLSGCAAPAADAPPALAGKTTERSPASFCAEGRAWLPPSSGGGRRETLVPFDANATDMDGVVALALGMRYAVDLPPLLADVEVEVRAPDGAVVARASLRGPGSEEATIRLEGLVEGPHALALLSYGGSGSGTGHFVDWRIRIEERDKA